jgi:hypothetical protein
MENAISMGLRRRARDRQSQMPQSTIRNALILYESSTVHLPSRVLDTGPVSLAPVVASSQKPPPTCLPGSTYADIRGRIFVCVTVNTWQYDDSKK